MTANAPRMLLGEAVGTALLLAVVVGSGHMGETLAQGNTALALLANSTATGLGLWWLIVLFAPICGAHFNPLVTLAEWALGRCDARRVLLFLPAQFLGALAGVLAAHFMFELPLWQASGHARNGVHQWWSEVVASFGLLTVILQVARSRPDFVGTAVGCYITGAYWFTASTSFANPAVTIARAFTDTFSGIRPLDAPGFIASQLVGAALALMLFKWTQATESPPHV